MTQVGFLVLVGLVSAEPVFAQTSAIERTRLRQPAVEAIGDPQLAMSLIAQERGDVVELSGPAAAASRFRVTSQLLIEHQSNAALTPSQSIEDWVVIASIELGYKIPVASGFNVDLSVRSELVRYFELEEASYWGPSGAAVLEYQALPELPRFYAGLQAYRYDTIDPADEITRAGAFVAGFDHTWSFNEGRTSLAGGYQFANFWSSPRFDDRQSHTLFAAVTQQLWGPVFGQISYYWQFTDFERQPREDSRHLVSAAVIYAISPSCSARLYTSFLRNESSNPLADYENLTAGIGAVLDIRF